MRNTCGFAACVIVFLSVCCGASKPHTVSFGKWTQIQLMVEGDEEKRPAELKVRALIIDGRTKEFVAGLPHEVTERTFVVQRVFERFLAAGIWKNSLAMAARGMAADRQIDGQSAVSFVKRLRSGTFAGKLVSRLCSVLRNVRRWKEVLRGGFATRQEEAIAEEDAAEFGGR